MGGVLATLPGVTWVGDWSSSAWMGNSVDCCGLLVLIWMDGLLV